MNLKKLVKENLPIILSGLAMGGAAGVGISAAVAQHKVEKDLYDLRYYRLEDGVEPTKQDIFKIYLKHYWVTGIIFALTSGSIIASNKVSKKRYDNLLKAYTSLGAGFGAYRTAVVEKYGESVDEELCEKAFAIMQSDEMIYTDLFDVPDKKLLFHEPESDTYFRAYERDIILAEYHLNRNFCLGGACNVSMLLDFLGLYSSSRMKNIGWNVEEGYYWIDIRHELSNEKINGESVYEICYTFAPEEGYLDSYYESVQPYYGEQNMSGIE